MPFLCECDDEHCQDYVPLTLPEFSEWSETLTFTAPDHAIDGAILISRTHAYTLHMTGPHDA